VLLFILELSIFLRILGPS